MKATAITKNSNHKARSDKTWVAAVPPLPIRTRKQHQAALDELMRLGRALDDGTAGRAEADCAHVLKLLVREYETRRFGRAGAAGDTPVQRLRNLVENAGMSASDLGRLLGDRSLGVRVLSGERALSKTHIRRLSDHFRIDAGYFL